MSNKCGIKCQWLKAQKIIVNPDGQVVPCCFFANKIFRSKLNPEIESGDVIIKSYIDQAKDLNAYNHSIQDIIQHDWFNELYDSWDDSDRVSRTCVRHCGESK